jgi:hypothetical protein
VDKNLGYFYIFLKKGQSKQQPNRQKFAQSGHPGHTPVCLVNTVFGAPPKQYIFEREKILDDS